MLIRHAAYEEAWPVSVRATKKSLPYMFRRHPFPTKVSLKLSPTPPGEPAWGLLLCIPLMLDREPQQSLARNPFGPLGNFYGSASRGQFSKLTPPTCEAVAALCQHQSQRAPRVGPREDSPQRTCVQALRLLSVWEEHREENDTQTEIEPISPSWN